MRVKDIEQYHELIEGHYFQLERTMEVLDILRDKQITSQSEKIKNNFSYAETNARYFCFLTSSFLNLLTTLKGFINSKTEWEIIYYSKYGFLTIYETINTFHYYQKNIREIINKNHPHLLQQYNDLNQLLKSFKKKYKYDTDFAQFRNKAAGHFDKDFLEYYQEIKKVDQDKSIAMIEHFLDFLQLLMHFVYKIIDEMEEKMTESATQARKKYLAKIKEIIEGK